jgi:hypothetical protein
MVKSAIRPECEQTPEEPCISSYLIYCVIRGRNTRLFVVIIEAEDRESQHRSKADMNELAGQLSTSVQI